LVLFFLALASSIEVALSVPSRTTPAWVLPTAQPLQPSTHKGALWVLVN
jgi:hypothetical protein